MKIAFLNAYLFDQTEEYQSQYSPQMIDYLKQVWPDSDVTTFECGLDQFPDSFEFDLFVIGGSAKSSYETDPWITKLKTFVLDVFRKDKPLMGICFGHQLIAEALGGKVEKAPQGWEIGTHSFSFTEGPQDLPLFFSHQDQVTRLPEQGRLLAKNNFCPIQVFAIADSVLCIQGHPEFTKEFLEARIRARKEILGEGVHNLALQSLKTPPAVIPIIEITRNFFDFSAR